MSYLLDTHTYFWWRADAARLPQTVRAILLARENELFLSVVTPWELAIKTQSGKLDARKLLSDFEERETAAGFVIVQPTATQAIRSGLFPFHHRDPFDRMLAAQAVDLHVTLLSRDRVFESYGVKRTWS